MFAVRVLSSDGPTTSKHIYWSVIGPNVLRRRPRFLPLLSFSFLTRSIGYLRNLLCFVFLLIQLGKSSEDFHLEIPVGLDNNGSGLFLLFSLLINNSNRHCHPPNYYIRDDNSSFRPVLRSRVSVICTLVSRLPFFSLDALRNICPPHSSLDGSVTICTYNVFRDNGCIADTRARINYTTE